jgi:ribonuclease HI
MKTIKRALPLLAVILLGAVVWAASPDRYLHVRVSNPTTHELVRVNVPLALAEKVIPAINHGQLHNGKIQVGNFNADSVNVRAILDALKTAPEGEFVTVQNNDSDVRVAKEHGQLVVHIVDKSKNNDGKQNVDVTIPWAVAQALISNTSENQLNIEAAIQALEAAGDVTLVTVAGHDGNVRVWIDSSSSDK